MRSDPSKVNPEVSVARRRSGLRRRSEAARRNERARRVALEALETRQLLATLPAAQVAAPVQVSVSAGNYSSPSIAVDPTNPNNLMMVWVRTDPVNIAADSQPIRVEGAFSTNGGGSWTAINSLYTRKIDPSTATGTPAFYAQATDPSVAFDRNGNVHLVVAQHSADNNNGEIQYNKIDFNTLARTEVVLTSWASATTPVNRALKPTIAVDDGVSSFTDVDANGDAYTQTTNGAGNVYVAWATNDDAPTGATNWNPNAIRIRASLDNGATFAAPLTVNGGGNNGTQRNTAPRIAVSQGTGTTPGGQVTVVWDDFGSGATASPPVSIIKVQRYQPGATNLVAVGGNVNAASTLVRGQQGYGGLTASAAQPLGIGPAPAIASDNTLGAYSPFQGRLYITYVGRFDDTDNPATNTDIYLISSSNGGANWTNPIRVNDDSGALDGFSGADVQGPAGVTSRTTEGGRPQLMPSVAVDQSTGTLVVTYSDTRFDAAAARVAQMVATSIDGGQSFAPQTFANTARTATDQATGQAVVLGPIPDNNSSGNNMQDKDNTFGFGDRQGLAVAGGRVYPAWSSNLNGGNDARQLLRVRVGQVRIAAGPRILDGTMGPVSNTLATDGGPLATDFIVTTDRRVDPSTFTAADVQLVARDVNGNLAPFQPLVTGVFALDTNAQGATRFRVTFQSQATPGPSTPGTISYTVGPNISDRIRRANSAGVLVSAGNAMDQDADGTPGEANADRFAAPRTVGTTPFAAPYVRDTLPLVIPGPRVVSTQVVGQPATPDNLVLNATVSSIDVTFDREMDPTTFEADGRDVLRIQGPAGLVSGPFTVTQLGTRRFRIGFATQQLSGTYTLILGPEIRSASGLPMDNDQDAGVDALRGTSTSAPVPQTYNSSGTRAIAANSTVTSAITLPALDDFVVQNVTLSLNVTFPNVPDLTAELVAPDGTVVALFSGIGTTGTQANLTNTVFDDGAAISIANGGPPFFGRFRPLDPVGLNKLNNSSSIRGPQDSGAGVYTLRITNAGASVGTINSWSITLSKPVTGTGLGELVSDRTPIDFRIFTMDPTNPLASTTWTSVGPASIQTASGTSGSGRIGGLAVDPSDPSGNTVYVAGATGGVWKTNNFLTTDPNGPIYIPLTDFGPTLGVNIGGIAVFGRNNDPNQSVVIVSTGDGDGGNAGVGFFRSMDGGATWALLDSTNNTLPFASRDRALVGNASFKVVADPRPTPSGQVILYAALSGPNGGIWRSTNTGDTWTRVRAGQATDVLLDPGSGPVDAVANPTGNLQVVYGAFRGEGVYISPNQGNVWNQLLGGVGNPLEQDPETNPTRPVPVNNQGATPNGAKGRIVLAKPALIPASEPNATLRNLIYQGWLFAYVATPNGTQDGLYVTKDQGQNWTRVRMPTLPNIGIGTRVVPSNDTGLADYDNLSSSLNAQGNYNIAITLDPNDPNIVYLGGMAGPSYRQADGTLATVNGFLRVDIGRLGDPHAYYLADDRPDGGRLTGNTTDGATLKQTNPLPAVTPPFPQFNLYGDPRSTPTINLIRNPFNPLGGASTFYTPNISSMNNSGAGARWIPVGQLVDGVDIHRMLSIRDPLTGKARLIVGNDHGVWSSVDDGEGNVDDGIGTAVAPSLSRNGNLQITQFYYGASQPSSLAAQVSASQALFYGQAQDDGFPRSDPDILNNGNLFWGFSGRGDGTGVATDQTGSGTLYQYNWPCCGGNTTDFFQVDGVGRTFGLIQQSGGTPVPDPQWPNIAGFNFAVNPVNGNQIVLSSAAGRVFRTQDQGQFWLVVGEPGSLDGTNAQALAYGAPLPTDPTGALDNFIYAGTVGGRIFVTFSGGGAAGNAWTNISTGLDGSGVQAIVTNPTRGSREAYAVTARGVYYMADAGAANPTWQNITANVFNIGHAPFGAQAGTQNKLQALKAIAADWRYVIPDNPANPSGPTHPMLYVAGNGGVYRSTDKGATWSLFPSPEPSSYYASPSPAGPGGGLPNADVRDLDLALGNVDPTNGRPIAQAGDPNILLATTFGRGSFAIRLAPVVFANTIRPSATLPAPNGSDGGTNNSGLPLIKVAQPVFEGLSQQTAFGHVVRITLVDLTDVNNPRIIGGYDPADAATDVAANRTDTFGRFSVQVNPGGFTTSGIKTIGIRATDASGTVGNLATYTFELDAQTGNVGQPPVAPTIGMVPADDTSGGLLITRITTPRITGVTDPSVSVSLYLADGAGNPTGAPLATGTTSATTGGYTLTLPTLADGTYRIVAVASNADGSSPASPVLTFQIKTTAPTVKPTFGLLPADDTGLIGDNATSNHRPRLTGVTEPNGRVQLFRVVNGARVGQPLATVTADAAGAYTIQFPNALNNGTIDLQVGVTDIAGNQGPYSDITRITVVTVESDYTGVGKSTPAVARREGTGIINWFAQGAYPPSGVAFGAASLDVPFTGDFDGDGISDRAVYRPGDRRWFLQRSRDGNINFQLGDPGAIPVAADIDGDFVTDVGAFNPASGTWTFSGSTAGTVNFSTPVVAPAAGDIPVPGNYDGAGGAEPAIYRPSTRQFFLQGVAQPIAVTTGDGGVEDPVPSNYNDSFNAGTGVLYRRTAPAVFNRTTGKWAIVQPDGSVAIVTPTSFVAGDIPAPGDFDGAGRAQTAVYRPSTGSYLVNGTTGTVAFGTLGDIPLTSPLVYRDLVTTTATVALDPSTDTGFKGDNLTSARRPVFSGLTSPNTIVDLIRVVGATSTVAGSATSNAAGAYTIGLSPAADLPNGVFTVQVRARNLGGALGQPSAPLTIRLSTTTGDYTGDGTSDQAVFRRVDPGRMDWYIRGTSGLQFGSGGLDIPLEADFNGDGRLEPAVYRPSTSQWFSRRPGSPDALTPAGGFGWANIDLPAPADFNGDGTTDIAVYRPQTTGTTSATGAGNWYIRNADGSVRVIPALTLALPGDIPVPGDYDNDGVAEPAVFRPSTSTWFILGSGGPRTVLFGGAGDIPVPGVYDVPGAGRRFEPAIFRPSTGQYFVLGPNGSRLQATFAAGDIPAPGDYNGDGLTDATVYRPSSSRWVTSTLAVPAPTFLNPAFGGPSDVPPVAPLQFRLPNRFGSGGGTGTIDIAGRSAALSTAPAQAAPAQAAPTAFDLGSTARSFSAGASTATPEPADAPVNVFERTPRGRRAGRLPLANLFARRGTPPADIQRTNPGRLF